jgi:hypothetical protein|tara:strand:+ start:103 stop:303 length:201 start_codon:yes stop_codon:yes gene_type:complete
MSPLDKLLNLVIAFSIIFVLVYACYQTLQLQDMWDMLIGYQNILAEQQKELRHLKILIIAMKGTSV